MSCGSWGFFDDMPSTPQVLVPNRYHVVPRTIIFVFRDGQVLLQKGAATKKINAGLWNGLGGHVERGEDVVAAAKRELFEEAGIQCDTPIFCGTIMIDVQDAEGILLFVFSANITTPEFRASEEGVLAWHPVTQLPAEQIVDDVPFLIQKSLEAMENGNPFHYLYSYDAAGNRIITPA